MITWTKNLSATDAQQPTTGGIVPYLRLIKGSLKHEDFQTWFRTTFFAGLKWKATTLGREAVEEAVVPFEVTVNGVSFGTERLTVTYGQNRPVNNNTPSTWLHWNRTLQNALGNGNFAGQPVQLTRDDGGTFHLDIG